MIERQIKIEGGTVGVTFTASPEAVANVSSRMVAGVGLIAPTDRPPLTGHYRVSMNGKSAQQVADAISALAVYHAAKSVRIYEGEPLLNATLDIDGESFTWTDCTVRERGNACELYVSVRDGSGKRPASMPMRIVRHTIADLPTNDEVAAMVTAAIRAERAAEAAQAAKMTELQTLLGG